MKILPLSLIFINITTSSFSSGWEGFHPDKEPIFENKLVSKLPRYYDSERKLVYTGQTIDEVRLNSSTPEEREYLRHSLSPRINLTAAPYLPAEKIRSIVKGAAFGAIIGVLNVLYNAELSINPFSWQPSLGGDEKERAEKIACVFTYALIGAAGAYWGWPSLEAHKS